MNTSSLDRGDGAAPSDLAWQVLTSESRRLFAVYDGARDAPRLFERLEQSGLPMACLIGGPLTSPLREAAPWCVQIDPSSLAARTIFRDYWGRAASIFVGASPEIGVVAVSRQLKQLLRVQLPSGSRAMFRFYDPRVLRVFLPTCDQEQWRVVMGSHESLWCESADGSGLLRWGPQTTQAGIAEYQLQPANDASLQG
jgi:hypothetical protein